MPRLSIASDHTGFALKEELVTYVRSLGYEIEDMGAYALVPDDDYPDLIRPLAQKVAQTADMLGIVIGGSGQGEAMVANRIEGVRCAVFYGQVQAMGAIDAGGAPALDGYDIVRLARAHNDANVLSLAARFVGSEDACEAVRLFLETPFSGLERHSRRISKF
jgi:ribose 5-phosphate isomerase B